MNTNKKSQSTITNKEYKNAIKFYENKLDYNPLMPRYNHMMAAISSEKGEEDKANSYYRTTIDCEPNNIIPKNDYAVHLSKHNRNEDALQQLKKAILQSDNNALLYKVVLYSII